MQDWKFYKAEGGKKRGHWSENEAFKNGAVQGYQAVSGTLLSSEIEKYIRAARRTVVVVEDSGSDSELISGDEDTSIPVEIEDWVRETPTNQASLQYSSEEFLAELRGMASPLDDNGPQMDGDGMGAQHLSSSGPRIDPDASIDNGLAVPSNGYSRELENVDELCSDVLRMHRNEDDDSGSAAEEMEIDYEFGWTGM